MVRKSYNCKHEITSNAWPNMEEGTIKVTMMIDHKNSFDFELEFEQAISLRRSLNLGIDKIRNELINER